MDDAMADRIHGSEIADRVRDVGRVGPHQQAGKVCGLHDGVVAVEDPQLEAARTRVDDEDPVEDRCALAYCGHDQSRISGWSSPYVAGVGAGLDPPVDHQLADVRCFAARGPAPGR